MKKVLVGLLVIVGVAGLIKLASLHNTPHLQVSGTTASAGTAGGSSAPSSGSNSGSSGSSSSGSSGATLKDGTYTGQAEETQFGPVQVSVTISGGKITAVDFPQMPSSHSYSQMVDQQAEPILRQEILQGQSANFNLISGATVTSYAVSQSLSAALSQA